MNKAVYIFDVDGVFNNIHAYEPDARVIKQVGDLLTGDYYVAINTGRGYPWVKENIIDAIREHISADKLAHVFISAEMGGVIVEFVDGVEQDEHTAFSLLPEQIEQVKQAFDSHGQSKNIAWYEGKVSMATIAKSRGVEATTFAAEAAQIGETLRTMFAHDHVKVLVNPDAIDVTTPEAGKWAGAQLIQDWLQRTPAAESKHFICFGDNTSDYEMARFFGQQGHTVDFVFTGKDLGDITHDPRVTLHKTTNLYNDGTYEFLSKPGA